MKTLILVISLFSFACYAGSYDLTGPKGLVLSNCTVTGITEWGALTIRHSRGVGSYDLSDLIASGTSNEVYAVELEAAKHLRKKIDSAPKVTLENANDWTFPPSAVVGGETFNEKELTDIYKDIKHRYALGAFGEPEKMKEIRGTVNSIAEDDLLLVNLSTDDEPVAFVDKDAKTMTDGDKIQKLGRLTGRYQYITVMGAKKTVKKYERVDPVTYNEFRYFIQSDGLSSFPEVTKAVKKKQQDRELDAYISTHGSDESDAGSVSRPVSRPILRLKGPEAFGH